jgi:negative regulator of sigma-B (phosphoserine phosphatase)
MGTLMAQPSSQPSAAIEWGVEARPFGGTGACGDVDIVVITERGAVVAVADGLGHRPEAVIAARTAADVIQQRADAAITELMTDCHQVLRKTRGAALSIAKFACHDGTMTWLGVGNVSAILARTDPSARPIRHALLLRGGVVGYRLPPLRPEVLPVFPGDTLIMASDGIASAFEHEPTHGRDPKAIARDILARHGKESDDALVLVARYLGATA